MLCEHFQESLAEQLDGPLPSAALQHLETCPDCLNLTEDLQLIQATAREWGAEDAIPSPRIWAAIQRQLEAEGLIADSSSPTWWSGFWNVVPRLEMAGAYVLLLLVAAGIAGHSFAPLTADKQFPAPVTATATEMQQASFEGLGRTLDGNMQQVVASFPQSAPVALSLRNNLTIVDNIIAVCEKTVREHPGDRLALEYLYGAYQQKADLLSVAMDRSSEIQ